MLLPKQTPPVLRQAISCCSPPSENGVTAGGELPTRKVSFRCKRDQTGIWLGHKGPDCQDGIFGNYACSSEEQQWIDGEKIFGPDP
jgi:hypothetical protein